MDFQNICDFPILLLVTILQIMVVTTIRHQKLWCLGKNIDWNTTFCGVLVENLCKETTFCGVLADNFYKNTTFCGVLAKKLGKYA